MHKRAEIEKKLNTLSIVKSLQVVVTQLFSSYFADHENFMRYYYL